MFHKIKLTCFNSPNLLANGIINKEQLFEEVNRIKDLPDKQKLERVSQYKVTHPQLLTMQWVISSALKWGIEHPLFVSKVLGEFPNEDSNAVMTLSSILGAQARKATTEGIRSIGVDPARYGADKTVITVLEGVKQTHRIVLDHCNTSEVTGRIVKLINDMPRKEKEVVCVDSTGLGAGVFDQLMERRSEGTIHTEIVLREIHFGNKCPNEKDQSNYSNLKAKMFMLLGEDIKKDLSILDESVYLEELPTILYKFDSRGRFVIESKDDYKKRTGLGSPDNADSLALANYGRHDQTAIGELSASMLPMNNGPRDSSNSTIVGSSFGDKW